MTKISITLERPRTVLGIARYQASISLEESFIKEILTNDNSNKLFIEISASKVIELLQKAYPEYKEVK